jgi:preprotein translocase subunit SecA
MVRDLVRALVQAHAPEKSDPEEWDLAGLVAAAEQYFLPPGTLTADALADHDIPELRQLLEEKAAAAYAEREEQVGAEAMREYERQVLLRVVSTQWIEHLEAMDDLREGIGLRAYGQLDPLTQYKIEAFEMFEEMIAHIREEVVRLVHQVHFVPVPPAEGGDQPVAQASPGQGPAELVEALPETPDAAPEVVPASPGAAFGAAAAAAATGPVPAVAALPPPRLRVVGGAEAGQSGGAVVKQKVGRNDPCPCGSGKKYKHCHGR